jgi:hypothetical protein
MNDVEAVMVVRVDVDPRGGWQVRLPGQRTIRCATREEAERAARRGTCDQRRESQLLVRDAYGRVMDVRTLVAAGER